MQSRLFRELLRRPFGLGALLVLGLLYAAAIFAGFLSPYAINQQSLTQTYHPPTKIFWQDGGLRVQAYELADPSTAEYRAIEGKSYPLDFFVKGFEYRLLGILPMRTHLFGIAPQSVAQGNPSAETAVTETETAQTETTETETAQTAISEANRLSTLAVEAVAESSEQPQATAQEASHTGEPAVQTDNPTSEPATVQAAPSASLLAEELIAPTPTAEPRIYLLGSDSTGRDVFSRLLYGSRVSLTIGLIGISITMVLGFLIGGFSGYFGGRFDFVAMRGVEFLMAIPGLYLLLALRAALAPYFVELGSDKMFLLIVVILSLVGWAGAARILRGLSLALSRQQFVLAAESMGQSPLAILRKHILPNLASYLLVAATLSIPGYILGEAALSFLGLGIQEPATSWGLMLSQAQDIKIFYLNFWWLLTPGAAILVTVMAFNILGDNLREIISPKS